MKKIASIALGLMMLLTMMPMSIANAAEPTKNMLNSLTVTRANPTNLYYVEEAHVLQGIPSYVNVTPTKGRSLRVWLLVKEGTVNMQVFRSGLFGTVTVFEGNYGPGDRDVEVVSNCNGGTYRVQFTSVSSANAYNPISVLIYETGG